MIENIFQTVDEQQSANRTGVVYASVGHVILGFLDVDFAFLIDLMWSMKVNIILSSLKCSQTAFRKKELPVLRISYGLIPFDLALSRCPMMTQKTTTEHYVVASSANVSWRHSLGFYHSRKSLGCSSSITRKVWCYASLITRTSSCKRVFF